MLIRIFQPSLNTRVPILCTSQSKIPYPLHKSIKDLTTLKSFTSSKVDQRRTRPLAKFSETHASVSNQLDVTIYHNLTSKESFPNLLALLLASNTNMSMPVPIMIVYGDRDLTSFEILSYLIPSPSALCFFKDESFEVISGKSLWLQLRRNLITSLLLCPVEFSKMLGENLISSTLPKIVSGYYSLETVFADTHPY